MVASLWPLSLAAIGQPSALATFTVGSIYFWGLCRSGLHSCVTGQNQWFCQPSDMYGYTKNSRAWRGRQGGRRIGRAALVGTDSSAAGDDRPTHDRRHEPSSEHNRHYLHVREDDKRAEQWAEVRDGQPVSSLVERWFRSPSAGMRGARISRS